METPAGLAAEPQRYEGVDGFRRWWTSFLEVMDEVTLEAKDFHEIAPGKIVIETVMRAVGGASGIETTQSVFMIATLRDGKMVAHRLRDKPRRREGRARRPNPSRARDFRLRHAALAQDLPRTARLERGHVHDRRRLPGQLAAVDREVGAFDDLGRHVRELATAPARPPGSPRSERAAIATPASGLSMSRIPSRSGSSRQASG